MSRIDDFAKKMREKRAGNIVEKKSEEGGTSLGTTSVLLESMKTEGTHDGASRLIPLDLIEVNRQHREEFNEESIRELAGQIKQDGLYNAILVRPIDGGRYELIQGERRYRAYTLLKSENPELDTWNTIRATLREMSDYEKHIAQLAENIQREDMRPVEEAKALRDLLGSHQTLHGEKLTVRALGDLVGKSQSWISKRLSLLDKPAEVHQALKEGKLTVDQAAHSQTKSVEPKTDKANKPTPAPMARVDFKTLENTVKKMNKLCTVLELPNIDLPSKSARKDYVAAFELRVTEILDAAYRKLDQQ